LGVAVGGWWLVYAAFIFKTSIYFMTKSTYVMSYMYGISNLCVSIPGIYIGIRVALGYGCGRLALGCLSAFLTFIMISVFISSFQYVGQMWYVWIMFLGVILVHWRMLLSCSRRGRTAVNLDASQ